MGAPLVGSLIGGGLSYLGSRQQARATDNANAANVAEQRRQQDYYESTVGPGVDYAKAAFASGVPQQYVQPQYDAAGYSAGLGRYYGDQAIPEYERGRRLEDTATEVAYNRLGITPQSLAQEQVALGGAFANPYQQQVTNQAISGVQSDFNERERKLAGSLAGRGQLGSTIANQRASQLEGARATALGDLYARENAKGYALGLDRAVGAQNRGYDIQGAAGQALAQQGLGATQRGQGLADRAVSAGEQAGRLGLEAAYGPAREYLSTVQSPASSRPTVTTPQPSGVNPLAYGAGIGLQTYYDLANQNR